MWRDSDGLVSYGRGACARVGDLLGGLNGVALHCKREELQRSFKACCIIARRAIVGADEVARDARESAGGGLILWDERVAS
jgi:hypothetical protein